MSPGAGRGPAALGLTSDSTSPCLEKRGLPHRGKRAARGTQPISGRARIPTQAVVLFCMEFFLQFILK